MGQAGLCWAGPGRIGLGWAGLAGRFAGRPTRWRLSSSWMVLSSVFWRGGECLPRFCFSSDSPDHCGNGRRPDLPQTSKQSKSIRIGEVPDSIVVVPFGRVPDSPERKVCSICQNQASS